MTNEILAPCAHALIDGQPEGCLACDGSGFVRVIPGQNGKAVACQHAGYLGAAGDCLACMGSGWAGLRGDGLFS